MRARVTLGDCLCGEGGGLPGRRKCWDRKVCNILDVGQIRQCKDSINGSLDFFGHFGHVMYNIWPLMDYVAKRQRKRAAASPTRYVDVA